MRLAAYWFPGFLSLGHLHFPIFGIFVAVGLVLALWLSQRTAVMVHVSPERLWDAGVFSVLAAFAASRMLLVIADPRAFARYPLLVLTLPSLTYSGLFLTGVMVWLWLRWKHIPVMEVVDSWAPCAALLWAVLSAGHFVEGTDAGMPTQLPWGSITQGDTVLGPVHPVQIYTAVFALVLCVGLLRLLKSRTRPGVVAAAGLFVGGAGSFLLGMVQQPVNTYGGMLLDPAQWVALAAMLAGAFIMETPAHQKVATTSRDKLAAYLDEFVGKRGDMPVAWLKNAAFTDPLLLEVQDRFFRLPNQDPPPSKEYPWCGEQGLAVLRWYAVQLRERVGSTKKELR